MEYLSRKGKGHITADAAIVVDIAISTYMTHLRSQYLIHIFKANTQCHSNRAKNKMQNLLNVLGLMQCFFYASIPYKYCQCRKKSSCSLLFSSFFLFIQLKRIQFIAIENMQRSVHNKLIRANSFPF